MELKVDLGFEQLIGLIRQLPANQIAKLKAELDDSSLIVKSVSEVKEFQQFLLYGPIMSDEQFNEYQQHRKHFDEWRQK